MTTQTAFSSARDSIQLKVSRIQWQRVWKLLRSGVLVAIVAAVVALYMSGGSLLLSANGLVTRERIRVAAPFDARIAEVYVHPGDHVEAGQKIARVEAGAIIRSLSDIAAERARLSSRVAQLQARGKVIASTLSIAETSAGQANAFLQELTKAKQQGLAVWRTNQEISAAYLIAADKAASLRAESDSLASELAANLSGLEEVSQSLFELKRVYNGGVLTASVSGVVGPAISVSGQVLSGQNSITDIYTGESYVLAYLPDSYLFDISEGERVCVKAHNQTLNAEIERILPITEAVPPEFQIPSKVRDRGQLAKIAITDGTAFAIGQKISVTGLLTSDCRSGLGALVKRSAALVANLFAATGAKASPRRQQ
ncbi:MAG: HlyD family secretion protein [Rhodomicrobium sp.]